MNSAPNMQAGAKAINLISAEVVDNKDPLKMQRVQLSFGPEIDGNLKRKADLKWAKPCTQLFSAKNYGSFIIPPKGSRVWVMFEKNNTSLPVYIGGDLQQGCTPVDAFYLDVDDNTEKKGIIFLTPGGSIIRYNDVKDNGFIEIQRDVSKVKIDKDFVELSFGKSTSIVLDNKGITMTVSGSSITITPSNITAVAKRIDLN